MGFNKDRLPRGKLGDMLRKPGMTDIEKKRQEIREGMTERAEERLRHTSKELSEQERFATAIDITESHLQFLASQGVVMLNPDKELPDTLEIWANQNTTLDLAGFSGYESLIPPKEEEAK